VLVEVGDLRLDATASRRALSRPRVVASGRLYESAMNRND
jgi:hypothetical protein